MRKFQPNPFFKFQDNARPLAVRQTKTVRSPNLPKTSANVMIQKNIPERNQGIGSIAAILEHHQPPAFVLENVKHLMRHDKGRTFQVIRDTLTFAA